MIPASLAILLQTAVIGCAALITSLISVLVCLWPLKDEKGIREPVSVRYKENCDEYANRK
jgi:hypothetical protein